VRFPLRDHAIRLAVVNHHGAKITDVGQGIEGVGDNYQITLTKKGPMDVVSLEVEVTGESFSDKMGDMVGLKNQIENELRSDIGISILVKLVGAGSIPRSEGKAERVVDLREE